MSTSERVQKKFDKKLRKHQHIVARETGVRCVQTPAKHLAICNVGQVNGLTECKIIESFAKYGALKSIVLIPGKSCSFLSYETTESAVEAYRQCNNGQLKIGQDNKPVFLSFVESIPPTLNNNGDQISHKNWIKRPPGLVILDDFITTDEEQILLDLCFDLSISGTNNNNTTMKHRQVKHYGYEFNYDTNNVDKNAPMAHKIPVECNYLWERLKDIGRDFTPDQLTVNRYEAGQGIPHHIDTHSAFNDPILSLSLGSAVVMEFRRRDGDAEHLYVQLPRRSLAIMSGESRYNWSHGIPPRKFDTIYTDRGGFDTLVRDTRVSFTFRTVRRGECNCPYKSSCDSYRRLKGGGDDGGGFDAAALERLHVHQIYDSIASHFSETRHKPWPNVLDFVQSFDLGSILLDVGCGNGKYLGCNNGKAFQIGCDTSFGLIDVCKERGFEILAANCLTIPLKENSVDGAISIAVIHHLSTENRRLKAITEMIRVLRINGLALIYVWAKDQHKNNEQSNYIKQDRKHRRRIESSTISEVVSTGCNSEEISVGNGMSLPVHVNRTQFEHSDVLVPWKLKNSNNDNTYLRFYHVFEANELTDLCGKVPGALVVRDFYDQGNWCVVLKKVEIK